MSGVIYYSYYYYYEVSKSKIDIIHSLFGSSSNLFVKSGSHKKKSKTVTCISVRKTSRKT